MPESLELPGIDTAAPETPAAPPSADDTSTQSASVDTGAVASSDDAPTDQPDDEPQPRKPSRGGFQNRINELVAERNASNDRANQTLGLLERVVSGLISPAQGRAQMPAEEAPPRKENFNDWTAFEAAERNYAVRQGVREELNRRAAIYDHQQRQNNAYQQQQLTAQAVETLHSATGTQMQEAAARYPDYHDTIESCGTQIPVNVEAAMAVSGAAGDVAYYLAKNPQVIRQLAGLPDVVVGYHVTRIANAMRASATNVSNAPAPGRIVGNRGSAIPAYPKDATPEQHIAWENAQKRSQKRA